MLDLVPFAGAGGQMTDRDGNAEFVGQGLQLAFPEAYPHAVAAATIGGDQKFCRVLVPRAPHRLPPAPNGVDCEARRVFVDANTHPPGIVGDVVDAVGRRPTKFGDDEVVHPHRLGLTLRTLLTAAVLEIADQLLLLGIDRDRRLPRGQRLLHLSIDIPRLGIAVGMASSPRGSCDWPAGCTPDRAEDRPPHCDQCDGQAHEARLPSCAGSWRSTAAAPSDRRASSAPPGP